jgi:hypothetical protein
MNDLLALTGAAFSSAASLLELAKNIKNADLHDQIAELKVQLAAIKNDAASLLNENRELKEELNAMKNSKENPLVFNREDGLYYDSQGEGPFCPSCYDSGKERIHITLYSYKCPKCHEPFREKGIGAGVAAPPGRRPLPKIN